MDRERKILLRKGIVVCSVIIIVFSYNTKSKSTVSEAFESKQTLNVSAPANVTNNDLNIIENSEIKKNKNYDVNKLEESLSEYTLLHRQGEVIELIISLSGPKEIKAEIFWRVFKKVPFTNKLSFFDLIPKSFLQLNAQNYLDYANDFPKYSVSRMKILNSFKY